MLQSAVLRLPLIMCSRTCRTTLCEASSLQQAPANATAPFAVLLPWIIWESVRVPGGVMRTAPTLEHGWSVGLVFQLKR